MVLPPHFSKTVFLCKFPLFRRWKENKKVLKWPTFDMIPSPPQSVNCQYGSRSKDYLKFQIRYLDLELVAIIAMPRPTHHHKTFPSGITLKSLHIWTHKSSDNPPPYQTIPNQTKRKEVGRSMRWWWRREDVKNWKSKSPKVPGSEGPRVQGS